MKVLISGATGFIGTYLVEELLKNDYQIYALVRQEKTRLDPRIKQIYLTNLDSFNEKFDVLVNLAGENIASRPWTKKRKEELYESRIVLTNQIREKLKHSPNTVISMSAVGFYGTGKHEIFDENTPPNSGFSHDLCRDWELSAKKFSDQESRVVIFRLGVVLGIGGALDKMRLPYLFGLGGTIAGGQQWFPWIHIDDVINLIIKAVSDSSFDGIYNAVAPQQITQKDFAKNYAKSLKRPAYLSTPKFVFDLLFGEMACLLTHGSRVVPKKLNKQGYKFRYSEIDKALLDLEKQYQSR